MADACWSFTKGPYRVDAVAPWPPTAPGLRIGTGMTGTGLPPVSITWFEGAGDGADFQGARALPRPLQVPIRVHGRTSDELRARMREFALASNPKTGPVRVTVRTDDGEEWWADAVRSGGGDWARDGFGTDGRRRIRTTVELTAGDPYWTRANPVSLPWQAPDPGAAGLLSPNSAAELFLAASGIVGEQVVENPGDADAHPLWVIEGPGTDLVLTGASGLVLDWRGTLAAGEALWIDTAPRRCTIVDHTGTNRYAELAPAPRFWHLPPGESVVQVAMANMTAASRVTLQFWPRNQWVV